MRGLAVMILWLPGKLPNTKNHANNLFYIYYHDITLGNTRNILSNSTSYKITNATNLGNGNYQFGSLVIFDDPMTKDQNLRSPAVAAAQGFYLYDMRTDYSALFAFSLIFNSTEYKGTLTIMGSDLLSAPTRDLSVVGGTGDFFMARGIVTYRVFSPPDGYQVVYEC